MSGIDTSVNFLSDTPAGKDADSFSPTLKRYHRVIWTKPLPSGQVFELQERPRAYLAYEAQDRTFFLASDAITTPLGGKAARIIEQIPEGQRPPHLGYTIGSSILFPGDRIGTKMTINGARGTHPRIADRFDLTLECIRRHYRSEGSPLGEVLDRYRDFFELFVDFDGYVEFWLLHDLLDAAGEIRFFHHFDDFRGAAVPKTVEDYLDYANASNDFIVARNGRIEDYVARLV
ncbi:hypothetical protein AVL62_00980 [Serinicoccus chungangensis]|uniref:Uncharacterized protein n=1 Tax=Serinicoccus chungangensis TaxID=767452 RepID=A0A0W8I5B7_9MICO|nr:hypothetical protein [Serinicoccus chungangensis]KUG53404.1 hypothetical protein AVL62_00980 [Serinicoccus chungangensis]